MTPRKLTRELKEPPKKSVVWDRCVVFFLLKGGGFFRFHGCFQMRKVSSICEFGVIVILLKWTWVLTKELLEVFQALVNEFGMSINCWGAKVVKEFVMMNLFGPKMKRMEFQRVCLLACLSPGQRKPWTFVLKVFFPKLSAFCFTN